jgi:hypothetical protein
MGGNIPYLNYFYTVAGEFFASNVQITGAVPNSLNIKNFHQGVYDVSVSCTSAGNYRINIRKIDRVSNTVDDIFGSPFPFLVVPAAVAAETMVISGLSSTMLPVVGRAFVLFIQSHDRYGNKVEAEDSGVISGQLSSRGVNSARTFSVAGSTVYRGNGSFSVSFVATLAGQYSVSLRYQTIDIGTSRSLRSPFQA